VALSPTYPQYGLVSGMHFWKESSRVFEGTWRNWGRAVRNTREELFKRIKQNYEERHFG